jgi:hypothetical protein
VSQPELSKTLTRQKGAVMRLAISAVTIGVISIVGTAFAGDRPFRSAGPPRDARQNEPIIRPPAVIPLRGHAAQASQTDRHVAEFLRWKDQHSRPRR